MPDSTYELKDYWVTARWIDDDVTHEVVVGEIKLVINSWQDLPTELEIDGHTYKLEV